MISNKEIMDIIKSHTEEAIYNLTFERSTFKITSIQVENISKEVRQLCTAHICLVISEKVPHCIWQLCACESC